MEKPSSRICAEALHTFGPEMQMSQAQEECARLILEITRLRSGTGSVTAVADELADLSIIVEQLQMMFPMTVEMRRQKLAHLQQQVTRARAQVHPPPRVDTI